jgi:asparagine synthase (glutamine-hydrolysing)
MCGIAGFIGTGTLDDLKGMTQSLVHRGPDDQGLWTDAEQGVYLGHRRLSIIDLSDGHQPMWTADQRLGVIFNGEIYNHQELRKELERLGHVFVTDHSDTEVLLHGYRQWGTGLTSRLNGMWAFALYDRDKRLLFCSRDRFGKKPFYYTCQAGTFIFASELRALIHHPRTPTSVSQRALTKYFAYGYVPAPYAIYADVNTLPGGHSLLFDLATRSVRVFQYWDFVLEDTGSRPKDAVDSCAEELRALIELAVCRRLVSDVPLGVFLSGGIDSSTVVACAVKHVKEGALSTFSIGFDDPAFDESAYAKRAAAHFDTEHHLHTFSLDTARGLLSEVMSRLDEPMGDSSLLPTYLLCRHTRQRVTVALSGDGGDELFAGYAPFRALRWAKLYRSLCPRPMHKAIEYLTGLLPVSHGYMSLDFKIKSALRGLRYPPKLWNPVWMSPVDEEDLADLLGAPVDLEDVFSEAINLWDAHPSKETWWTRPSSSLRSCICRTTSS